MLVSCMLDTVHTLLCESDIFNKYCTIKIRIWPKINLEYHISVRTVVVLDL